MNEFDLLLDLHRSAYRQGPGDDALTLQALDLAGVDRNAELIVADIGCGTGASTMVLARELNARITAVDFLEDFLLVLKERALSAGLDGKITTQVASMDALPFAPESLDLIWSEGAIYNIGFGKGVGEWRRFLRPGGVLAVSEITWLTAERPQELEAYWIGEYPEIASPSQKIEILERSGYSPIGYFTLPRSAWMDNYYNPIRERLDGFLERQEDNPAAMEVAAAERREIEYYERFADFFSYGFYLARRVG